MCRKPSETAQPCQPQPTRRRRRHALRRTDRATGEHANAQQCHRLQRALPARSTHQQVAQIPRRRAAGLGRRHGFWRGAADRRSAGPPARTQEYGYAAREGAAGRQRSPAACSAASTGRPIRPMPIRSAIWCRPAFPRSWRSASRATRSLLQLPSYPPFMRAIEDTGRRLIANPMRDNGTRWVLDLAAYEAAPDPRAPHADLLPPAEPDRPRLSAGRNWSRWRRSPFATTWSWCPTRSMPTSSIPATRTFRWRRCRPRSPRAPSPSPRPPRASTSPRCAAP